MNINSIGIVPALMVCAAIHLAVVPGAAQGSVIYDWTGTCDSGCVGSASAILTLNDSYTPGAVLSSAVFVSFTYTSSSGSYAFPADLALGTLIGTLPATSGMGSLTDVDAIGNNTGFNTVGANSRWISSFQPFGIFDDGSSWQWRLRAVDADGDGVNDDEDLCPDTAPEAAVDAVGCSDAQVDGDGDGVCNDGAVSNGPSTCVGADACPGTVIPEGVPTVRLGTNRWALVDDDFEFDTTAPDGKGPDRSYSTADTGGCSCEQIIGALGLGTGQEKFGCSIGTMDGWVALPR